ncbi:hypothetical protein BHM03_00023611 [Ensete ventricosum]|nr:hypothetical protein BHM03_00023611 [Ensete ventricosum]
MFNIQIEEMHRRLCSLVIHFVPRATPCQPPGSVFKIFLQNFILKVRGAEHKMTSSNVSNNSVAVSLYTVILHFLSEGFPVEGISGFVKGSGVNLGANVGFLHRGGKRRFPVELFFTGDANCAGAQARNVYREELVDCVRQCAWYRISLFSRWKQRGMYATCMWVVELLLVLSNTDSVFCYVPEFYLESLVNVDSFHALRKSDPSFVSSAIFIKQGLASFVSRSAIPNYSTCIGRYVLVRPQIDTQRARYWAVSSIGAIFALISIVAARYRAILAEGEGRRGRRGRRKGRTWRSGIALLRRSQSVVVLSRHSLDSIDEMSPPLLRQRGLGVVGDFSSAWGEEAPTISLRFLSRVGRRNEARSPYF